MIYTVPVLFQEDRRRQQRDCKQPLQDAVSIQKQQKHEYLQTLARTHAFTHSHLIATVDLLMYV